MKAPAREKANFKVYVRVRPSETGAQHCTYGRTSAELQALLHERQQHPQQQQRLSNRTFEEEEHINDPRFVLRMLEKKPVLRVEDNKIVVEPPTGGGVTGSSGKGSGGGASRSQPTTPRGKGAGAVAAAGAIGGANQRFERVASHTAGAAMARAATPTFPHNAGFTEQQHGKQQVFAYDACFSSDIGHPNYANQSQFFDKVGRSVVDTVVEDGFNATVIAYGQTGSGKTYTMLGPNWEDYKAVYSAEEMRAHGARGKKELVNLISGTSDRGLTLRICEDLFDRLYRKTLESADVRFEIQVEYLEVYNETVVSLLGGSSHGRVPLRVRATSDKGVWLDNLEPVCLSLTEPGGVHDGHFDRASTYIQLAELLRLGTQRRSVASTPHNVQSSRSHAIMNIIIDRRQGGTGDEGGRVQRSKLCLVDLAGSERLGRSNIKADRLTEASQINKSLSTLGRVIMALTDTKTTGGILPPYRDSLLTLLLKESFGGDSRTSMIATVSPQLKDLEETLSTLNYSSKAKLIKNKPKVNSSAAHKQEVEALQRQIEELRRELELAKMAGGGAATATELEDRLDYLQHRQSTRWTAEAAQMTELRVLELETRLEEERRRAEEAERRLRELEEDRRTAKEPAGEASQAVAAPMAPPTASASGGGAASEKKVDELYFMVTELYRALETQRSNPAPAPAAVATDTKPPVDPKNSKGGLVAVRFEDREMTPSPTDAFRDANASGAAHDFSRASLLRGMGHTPGHNIRRERRAETSFLGPSGPFAAPEDEELVELDDEATDDRADRRLRLTAEAVATAKPPDDAQSPLARLAAVAAEDDEEMFLEQVEAALDSYGDMDPELRLAVLRRLGILPPDEEQRRDPVNVDLEPLPSISPAQHEDQSTPAKAAVRPADGTHGQPPPSAAKSCFNVSTSSSDDAEARSTAVPTTDELAHKAREIQREWDEAESARAATGAAGTSAATHRAQALRDSWRRTSPTADDSDATPPPATIVVPPIPGLSFKQLERSPPRAGTVPAVALSPSKMPPSNRSSALQSVQNTIGASQAARRAWQSDSAAIVQRSSTAVGGRSEELTLHERMSLRAKQQDQQQLERQSSQTGVRWSTTSSPRKSSSSARRSNSNGRVAVAAPNAGFAQPTFGSKNRSVTPTQSSRFVRSAEVAPPGASVTPTATRVATARAGGALWNRVNSQFIAAPASGSAARKASPAGAPRMPADADGAEQIKRRLEAHVERVLSTPLPTTPRAPPVF